MISIIIPKKGYDEYVDDCVASIIGQTYEDYEVIVEEYEGKSPSEGRNKALKWASGDYILFLDIDDKMRPEMLEEMIKLADENTIVACGCQYFGDENHVFIPDRVEKEDFLTGNRIIITSLVPKSLTEKIEFDEQMEGYEDWDYWVRATQLGYKVKVIDKVLIDIRSERTGRNKEAIRNHSELHKYILDKCGL